MSYKIKKYAEKAYKINTEFQGEQISFNVVVANNESEIPDLVAFHLNNLSNPKLLVVNKPEPCIQEILKQQQTVIDELKAEVAALKGVDE